VTTCANDRVADDVLGSCDSLSPAAAAATDDEMTGSVLASQCKILIHNTLHIQCESKK